MENSKIKRNIKPFNGEKYSVWKFRIRALLSEMDVIKVIDEDPVIRCTHGRKITGLLKVFRFCLTGDYQEDAREDEVTFILDSVASDHIIKKDDLFITYAVLKILH